jgi:hypothetical protein
MTTVFEFMLDERQGELQALENLAVTSELVGAVSQTIHSLQRERGFSNLHLGGIQSRFTAGLRLLSLQSQTDTLSLRTCFDRLNQYTHCPADRIRLLNRVALAVYLLDDLPRLRQKVEDRLMTADESIQAFTQLINALLAVVFEAADTAVDPLITSALVALFNFMQAKELAGQERAIGVVGFITGYFDSSLRDKMHFLLAGQRRCIEVFAEFSESTFKNQWAAFEQQEINNQIAQLRGVAERTAPTTPVSPQLAEIWFELASERMDWMKIMEDEQTTRLRALCAEKIQMAQSDLEDHSILLQRLASLDEPAAFPTARLFNVQAVELGSSPADSPGVQLGRSILDLLHAQTIRLQAMSIEMGAARHALSERKTIERAKGELMRQYNLKEEVAYANMQKQAMNQGVKLVDIAHAILKGSPAA